MLRLIQDLSLGPLSMRNVAAVLRSSSLIFLHPLLPSSSSLSSSLHLLINTITSTITPPALPFTIAPGRTAATAAAGGRSRGAFRRRRRRLANADMAPGGAAAAPAGLRNVFVYGSLLAEEVLSVLLERVPPRVDAVVENFHRFSIRDRVYPAAVPFDGRTIAGKILLDLTDDELKILDEFESTEYIRTVVEPKLVSDTNLGKEGANAMDNFQAFVYVWEDATDKDLFGDWDYEEWRQHHLKDFLAMCEGFISEFRSF